MSNDLPGNIDANLIPLHFIVVVVVDGHGVEELPPNELRRDLRIERFARRTCL